MASIIICFLSIAMAACNNQGNQQKGIVKNAVISRKNDSVRISSKGAESSRKEATNGKSNALRAKILGIWAFVGDENATFVIENDKITYPDHDASYKYVIENDSIHIKFDGYEGNYLVKTKGMDTLVLVGDEQQVYYRFKN